MAGTQKANKAVEEFAESTKGSYQTVIEHAVGLGERNVRFARGVIESYAKEVGQQAESNRALVEEFVDRAEKQRGAVQSVVEESVDAYMDFVFAPFSYYKEGLEAARKVSA